MTIYSIYQRETYFALTELFLTSHVIITTINTMKTHMDPKFISLDLTHLTPILTPQLEFLTSNQKST